MSATCRRANARKAIVRPSTLRIDASEPLDVLVQDLSVAGFRFVSSLPIPVGTLIRVGLAGSGQAYAQVTWSEGCHHGSLFTPALDQSTLDAAFTHDQAGMIATIVRRSRTIPAATTAPIHDMGASTASQGDWRIAPLYGFVFAMLIGGLGWKLLVLLLSRL